MPHRTPNRSCAQDVCLFHLKRFYGLCLVVFLCCHGVLAAGRSQGRLSDAGSEITRRLAYHFDFSHPGRVHISLETASPPTGVELLDLPSTWAEATDLERAIQNLKITGSAVSLVPTSRPSRLTLRAKPGTPMRLDYDLVQDWAGPFRASQRHRVLVQPELIEFNGETGLVVPKLESGAPVQLTLDFEHVPAGQTVVTSFGTELHEQASGPWSEVAHAMFAVGEFSTRRMTVLGGPVLLAVAGSWSFSEQELALKVQQILAAERTFWRTPVPVWYAVVLAPFAIGTSGGGGTAFTHAVSLYLAPGEHFGVESESLFAHEAFHAWNPTALGTVTDTTRLAWFIEGFTTYYQDVLLERSGMMDRQGYLKRVNATLRDYLRSPAREGLHGSPESGGDPLDDDETRARDPYVRGAWIALWLDAEIARQTQARASLDDLMRVLLEDHAAPLTEERILQAAGRFVEAKTVRRLRSFVAEDAAVPIEEALPACTQLTPKLVWTFALGLPMTELSSGALLHDVDAESAAYRAGLRDGQTLLAWSLWHGDPDHEVLLTVRGVAPSPAMLRIRYLPRGRQVTIPQVELLPNCNADGTTH